MRPLKLLTPAGELPTLYSPLSMCWEITPVCNYNCTFCYCKYERSEDASHPRLDFTKTILSTLKKALVFDLKLTGGEVTLYPFLGDLLKDAYGMGFRISMITNGHFIDMETLESLKEFNVSVAVSVHGPSSKFHDDITRFPKSFEKLIRTIHAMSTKGIPVHVMYSPTRSNYKLVYETIKMLACRGLMISYLQVHRIVPRGECRLGIHENIIGINEYIDIFQQLTNIENEFGIGCEITDSLPLCRFPIEFHRFIHSCSYGITSAKINWKGDITTCPCSSYFIGNILEQDLSDLWQTHHQLISFRKLKWINDKCRECSLLGICLGGCRHTSQEDVLYSKDVLIAKC